MSQHLPQIFARLKNFCAPLSQYKICSTFDSSPQVGSIGRALQIGLETYQAAWAPIIVGAPNLRRYQVFGNLFARIGNETFRLDRHPTMRSHPVTPMNESDLRIHLSRQTGGGVGLVDVLALACGLGQQRIDEAVVRSDRAVLLDILDEPSLIEVGRLIWENRVAAPFAVASSGLEYALVAYWRVLGLLEHAPTPQCAGPVDRIGVLSGSCSPETEASIRWALNRGYVGIPLDVRSVVQGQVEDALCQASSAAAEGRSFIFYTALGTDGPALIEGNEGFRLSLSEQLGRLFSLSLDQTGIHRAVVCGGDTSSGIGRKLDLVALTAVCPLAPGSPLCRAWSDGPLDGLEIVFKGGQVGGPAFLEETRTGKRLST
jgi:uncharacterized protein YgbK (DUF1537 family)